MNTAKATEISFFPQEHISAPLCDVLLIIWTKRISAKTKLYFIEKRMKLTGFLYTGFKTKIDVKEKKIDVPLVSFHECAVYIILKCSACHFFAHRIYPGES